MDTHCHIQSADYLLDAQQTISEAVDAQVTRLLCVGTTLKDSQDAIALAERHANVWATIGIHPHESDKYTHDHHSLQQFRELANNSRVVAVGETGLDYYYNLSTPENQKKLLRFQLDIAVEFGLPLVFHIREAFEDFWKIFDEYEGISGVVHSFTAHKQQAEEIISRGLYVGVNGIITFTKDQKQLEAIAALPLDRIILETDSPFLTPVPYRGTICQPKHLVETAKFLAELRGESVDAIASATTKNATSLFNMQ